MSCLLLETSVKQLSPTKKVERIFCCHKKILRFRFKCFKYLLKGSPQMKKNELKKHLAIVPDQLEIIH